MNNLATISVLIVFLTGQLNWTEGKPTDGNWASSEEEECPKGQFWHIRGHQCVLERCPRGNAYRNHKTGKCVYKTSKRIQYDSEEKIGRHGLPIGSQGFYQPRGMSIMPFYKMHSNGKRYGHGDGSNRSQFSLSRGRNPVG